jgi:DNA helicase-2/ATP-dependent DNA helicase PcrA
MNRLTAFLEHVSLVMDNENQCRRAQGHDHDDPRRQGPGIRHGVPRRLGGRHLPLAARARRRRPRLPRGGAPPRLCRDHPRPPPATILHAANRRIYGQWTSSLPSRFVAELPDEHIESESTMSGGASLWRANWSERADPFADVGSEAPAAAPAGSAPRGSTHEESRRQLYRRAPSPANPPACWRATPRR